MRLMTDLLSSTIFLFFLFSLVSALDFRYHRYNKMKPFLYNFTAQHSNLARIHSIGKSIEGRDLLVVELSAAGNKTLVPNVKLIGNIHGNEAVGREVLLHFLEFMVDNYATNPNISWFLNNTRLHILPSLNPDGFEKASVGLCDYGQGRNNANDSDLNRSFPDFFRKNRQASQPESEAVQKWMKDTPFILSASLHGGALVANYPYENVRQDVPIPRVVPPSVSPDDDVFQHLASLYSNKHPTMHLGKPCKDGGQAFKDGIINGAAWYMITGGMQDYNYAYHGCMEITLEISCCKYPAERELPGLWEENKMALFDYIMEAHKGVKGQIIDGITKKPIAGAVLQIKGRDMIFNSSNNGEFWRLLRPNFYKIKVTHKGYDTREVSFQVKYQSNSFPEMTSLEIEMYPIGHTTVPAATTTDASFTDGTTELETESIPIRNQSVRHANTDENDTLLQPAAVIQNHSSALLQYSVFTWICLFAVLFVKIILGQMISSLL